MINNRITVIPRIYKPSEVQDVELKEVLNAIRTGIAYEQDLKWITRKIQLEPDHAKQNKMKYNLLPVVLPNGIFGYKNDESLKVYSSFTAIDLDNFGSSKEMNNVKMMLMKDSSVYAIYTTPSGKGLKAIIIHDNLSPDYHGELYDQLLVRYQISTLDTSVSDLSRGHYICYDPNIYINYNPIPYNFIHNPAYIPKQKLKAPRSRAGSAYDISHLRLMLGFKHPIGNKSDQSIINILNSCWKKQPNRWKVGNRKNSVFQAASELCNAGVNIDKALDYLVNEYTTVGLPVDDILYQAIQGYQRNYETYGINRIKFDVYGKRR